MKLTENQRLLLNGLIDKYEKKQGYGIGETSSRGTIIDVKKLFLAYTHISNSLFKNEINFEMKELESNHYIRLVWERHNVGEYLEKIYLNEDELPAIYQSLNRIPKIEKYKQVKQFILEFQEHAAPMLIPLLEDTLLKIDKLERLISIVDIDDVQLTSDYFKGLNELLKNTEKEISKRHWSIQLYNDSKRWGILEQKIISVLSKEIYPEYNGLETGTILGYFGIIENPIPIDIYGNCKMSKDGKEIDFSIDVSGIGMYPTFYRSCEVTSLNVDRILTIENKTSYHDYLAYAQRSERNELILYLGGYHNQIRTLILKKLYQFIQLNNLDVPFYHWGDIDFGGLSILVNLREKTKIPFQPFLMDIETYQLNINIGKEITEKTYLTKLESLLGNEKFEEFEGLIRVMLDRATTIEQESIKLL